MSQKISAEEAYNLHRGLMLHFNNDNYDFFKYGGKVTRGKFSNKPNKIRNMYMILAKKNDLQSHLIANLLKGDAKWIGDLLTDEADDNCKEYLKRLQSLSYYFKNEIDRLRDMADNSIDIFTSSAKTSYPLLLTEFHSGRVSIFTMSILNDFFDYAPKYDKKYGEHDFFWVPMRLKIFKIKNFFEYDKRKFLNIAKDVLL